MNFCVIRLGKSSVDEILKINSTQLSNDDNFSISIKCKQVPTEVDTGTYCFIWLGSDNNKGIPTPWKQGLRAFGQLITKEGATYADAFQLQIDIILIFKRSINKTEILKSAGLSYINIANVPVVGLNTSSNQTVQLIKQYEEGQEVPVLINSILNTQGDLEDEFKRKLPELFDSLSLSTSKSINNINTREEEQIEQSDEENVVIKIPFDPNLIRLRRDPYTLGELIDRIEHDEINFFTGFQRKSGLWDVVQQSRLIESVLLRLPLPAFYFDESEDNKWQVIDGLQRTTAIKNFIVDKSLTLERLEFLTDFNGKRYDDLPRDLIRRIKTSPLTVYVVEKGTPDEVKFNIFKRINTGGLILTPQEIRHALNQGIPADLVAELANSEEFKEATCYIINPDRMEDRDFTTRFVAFFMIPFFEYEPDLDSFMTKGMASLKYTNEEFRQSLKYAFREAMVTAILIFGNDAFRKREDLYDRRKPLNKAIFETLSVCLAKLSDDERKGLRIKQFVFRNKFITLNNDSRFRYSISSGTGQLESVITRFTEMNRIISETLNDQEYDQ